MVGKTAAVEVAWTAVGDPPPLQHQGSGSHMWMPWVGADHIRRGALPRSTCLPLLPPLDWSQAADLRALVRFLRDRRGLVH